MHDPWLSQAQRYTQFSIQSLYGLRSVNFLFWLFPVLSNFGSLSFRIIPSRIHRFQFGPKLPDLLFCRDLTDEANGTIEGSRSFCIVIPIMLILLVWYWLLFVQSVEHV